MILLLFFSVGLALAKFPPYHKLQIIQKDETLILQPVHESGEYIPCCFEITIPTMPRQRLDMRVVDETWQAELHDFLHCQQVLPASLYNDVPFDEEPEARTLPSCQAVFGIRAFYGIHYLFLVSKATHVGADIYKVDEVAYMALQLGMTEEELQLYDEEPFNCVKWATRAKTYYSQVHDLSNLFQRPGAPLDPTFISNHCYQTDLLPFAYFRLPCIEGFVGLAVGQLVKPQAMRATYVFVATKCIPRTGTRYNSRGIDDDGYVSNFIRLEQILLLDGELVFSHVQIRGSVPVHWKQEVLGLPVIESRDHYPAFARHMHMLVRDYRAITVLDLLNHKEEAALSEAYRRQCTHWNRAQPPIAYVDYDLNVLYKQDHKLGGMLAKVRGALDTYGYYCNYGGQHRQQTGSVRTNCLDCLDRTNLAQVTQALYALTRFLEATGIVFDYDDFVSPLGTFEQRIRPLWRDEGDDISLNYVGTGAHKRSLVGTGCRYKTDGISESLTSGLRLVNGWLWDQNRQDLMEFYYGKTNKLPVQPNVFKNTFDALMGYKDSFYGQPDEQGTSPLTEFGFVDVPSSSATESQSQSDRMSDCMSYGSVNVIEDYENRPYTPSRSPSPCCRVVQRQLQIFNPSGSYLDDWAKWIQERVPFGLVTRAYRYLTWQ